MEDLTKGIILVRQKPYKVSKNGPGRFITMPTDIEPGSLYHMWRYPDGRILFVPEKKDE